MCGKSEKKKEVLLISVEPQSAAFDRGKGQKRCRQKGFTSYAVFAAAGSSF